MTQNINNHNDNNNTNNNDSHIHYDHYDNSGINDYKKSNNINIISQDIILTTDITNTRFREESTYKIDSTKEVTNHNKCLICYSPTQYRKLHKDNTYLLSFVLCDICQNQNALYSKSFCINELLLSKSDLDNIRCFYKGNAKLFLEYDVRSLIKQKYGSENDYTDYKQNKILQKYKKINNILQKREDRRKILMEQLADYKLELKTYGDCYTFIQFGYPKLENVIKNELEKCRQKFVKYSAYKNCIFGNADNISSIPSLYYFEDNYKNKSIGLDDEHSISSFF